jgi:quercetin dioxygenase-like cupin family protein
MGVVHRQTGRDGTFAWEGVDAEPYQGGGASAGGCRSVLIGPREGAANFAVRYFEIPPDGRTSSDRHAHDHGIVVLRGRARARLGPDIREVGPGDAVYIPPNEPHQFETLGAEPFGFLCVIPSKEWLETRGGRR